MLGFILVRPCWGFGGGGGGEREVGGAIDPGSSEQEHDDHEGLYNGARAHGKGCISMLGQCPVLVVRSGCSGLFFCCVGLCLCDLQIWGKQMGEAWANAP